MIKHHPILHKIRLLILMVIILYLVQVVLFRMWISIIETVHMLEL